MRSLSTALFLALFLLTLSGCDEFAAPGQTTAGAANISFTSEPTEDQIAGADVEITVEVTNASGNPVSGEDVTFTVTAGGGSVGQSVVATGQDGTATTTWTLGGTTGEDSQSLRASVANLDAITTTATVTPGPVTALDADTDSLTLDALSDTAMVSVTATDSFGNDVSEPVVMWSSSDTAVATVDSGAIVSVANGTAEVVATSGDGADTVDVTVEQVAVSVSVSPGADTLPRHETLPLQATATDANGFDVVGVTVDWSSSDTTLATVDSTGTVLGIGMGEATIGASAGSGADSATVLVAPAVTDALAANWRQTCALEADGTAYCWGANMDGQTGAGHASMEEATPQPVTGGLKFQAIGTGIRASCGLSVDGGLYCWGNWFLNPDSTLDPFRKDNRTYEKLAVGLNHACAIDTAGDVYCWGSNTLGALGAGSAVDSTNSATTPLKAQTSDPMVEIDAGSSHVCAISDAGDTYCWGNNFSGQLGDGTTDTASTPQLVSTSQTFAKLALGTSHSCALTDAGEMYCWGRNGGAFGNGTQDSSLVPVAAGDTLTFRNAEGGSGATCGTTESGEGYCWGWGSTGRFGITSGQVLSPTSVGSFAFLSLALQGGHTCGIGTDGVVSCTGSELLGVRGDGEIGYAVNPQTVQAPTSFVEVESGLYHSCALDSGGTAYCWGQGSSGALGNGALGSRATPTEVSGGHTFTALSLGYGYSCGLKSSGELWCWGYNGNGQIGNGGTDSEYATPQLVADTVDMQAFEAGYFTTCGVATNNTPYCWGFNGYYNYGNSTNTASNTPVVAASDTAMNSLSAEFYHGCGVGADSTGYCWGYNLDGLLGYGSGSTTLEPTPIQVNGGHAWAEIETSVWSNCGLTTGGTAYCWGLNISGELGVGDTNTRYEPTAVSGGMTFQDLETSVQEICAFTSGGDLYCWGNNGYGNLGTGSAGFQTADVLTPNQVSVSGVTSVGVGRSHTCAITSSGTQCLGLQVGGLLGDGEIGYREAFQPVSGGLAVATTFAPGYVASSGSRSLLRGPTIRTGVTPPDFPTVRTRTPGAERPDLPGLPDLPELTGGIQ